METEATWVGRSLSCLSPSHLDVGSRGLSGQAHFSSTAAPCSTPGCFLYQPPLVRARSARSCGLLFQLSTKLSDTQCGRLCQGQPCRERGWTGGKEGMERGGGQGLLEEIGCWINREKKKLMQAFS